MYSQKYLCFTAIKMIWYLLYDCPNSSGAVKTESSIGLSVIRHKQKKPACIDEVIQHFSTGETTVSPDEICVIGEILLVYKISESW